MIDVVVKVCRRCGQQKAEDAFRLTNNRYANQYRESICLGCRVHGPRDPNAIDGADRACRVCQHVKSASEFYVQTKANPKVGTVYKWRHVVCKECYYKRVRANHKTRLERNPLSERLRERHKTLRYNYGIGLEEYDAMLKRQVGRCKICNMPERDSRHGRPMPLAVDHCHKTDRVRGLLCHRCNKGIGSFGDDVTLLTKAIKYLIATNRKD